MFTSPSYRTRDAACYVNRGRSVRKLLRRGYVGRGLDSRKLTSKRVAKGLLPLSIKGGP